jgi:hypothetical protein
MIPQNLLYQIRRVSGFVNVLKEFEIMESFHGIAKLKKKIGK